MSASLPAVVVVLEPNRRVGERIARIVSAATGLEQVAHAVDTNSARSFVGPTTRLLACGEDSVEQVIQWFVNLYPQLRFLVWTAESPSRVIRLAAAQKRLSNILGWPRFQSTPRSWELGMAARRLVLPHVPAPALTELMQWGATAVEWTPRTSVERDQVVADVNQLAVQSGVEKKTAKRVSELAHELLMNAMYDAPVDRHGQPRYAFDRSREVVLEDDERPILRLATDGVMLAIEAADPFGGLQRRHVLDGIVRVHASEDQTQEIINASHGGAGIGMARLYTGSAVLVADIVRGRMTRVISVHDLNVSPRDLRNMPGSLHVFVR